MTDMPNLSTAKPKARLFWALDGPNTDTGPFTFNYDYYTEHDSDGDGVAAQYETLPTKEIDEQTLRREHVRRTVKLHIEKTLKAWASKRKVATDDPSSTGVEWKITSVSVADLDYFGVLKKEIRDEAYDGMDVTARRAVLTDFMDMITYDYSMCISSRFLPSKIKLIVTLGESRSIFDAGFTTRCHETPI